MRPKLPLIVVGFVVLFVAGLAFQAGTTSPNEATLSNPVTDTPSMKVVIDPATREIVDSPSPTELPTIELTKDLEESFSRSEENLDVIDAPIGGGKMVDLQGRFQNGYTASITSEGRIVAGCDIHKVENNTSSEKE